MLAVIITPTSSLPSIVPPPEEVSSAVSSAASVTQSVIATTTSSTISVISQTSDFLRSLDWTNPSWDLFIILFFIVGAFLYGLSLGRDRIIVILVSIYMALAVVNSAPFLQKIDDTGVVQGGATVQLTAFLGVFLALFFIVSRMGLMRTIGSKMSHGPWWQVLGFSILHVGLMVSIIFSYLPQGILQKFSPTTLSLFADPTAQFVWIVVPMIAMAMVGGEKGD